MSKETKKELRNQVMYQIFVRNFSKDGTFKAVILQLDRIKKLGVDIIWFAPIHPIGEKCRKGKLGSPYAISDYRKVNPEYGTMDDFKEVVSEIHKRGMKCIIDVVYNHTSPDSVLSKEHPEWFYKKEDGNFGNRVGEWTDIIDLDYNNKGLWDYQIETLRMWAEIVDGFRCDVAPIVPVDFWLLAKQEVEKVRPSCIWLGETTDPSFILEMRDLGINVQSDSEMFQAFDICYDYDIYHLLTGYASGKSSLLQYSEAINRQEYIYPDNYVKLRFLENHDQPRAGFLFPNVRALRNATAFLYFQKGMTLIYAGQEYGVSHLPSLFDKDTVEWEVRENRDLSGLMRSLYEIKKDPLYADSTYRTKTYEDNIIKAIHSRGGRKVIGVFSLRGEECLLPINLPDGKYVNKIDKSFIDVLHGYISLKGEPVILEA